MITNLDHVVVLARNLEAGVASYRTLLGREPSWRAQSDGAATAIFTLGNMSIELMAPAGKGQTADRVRAALEKDGEGLASFAFAVDDIAKAHRRLKRLGLEPADISDGESQDIASGKTMTWNRTRASSEFTHGIRMFFIQRHEPLTRAPEISSAPIDALDHVVIATPDPDRAAALYGARLGLDMRLDRTNPDWGARLMFFRCGDLVVEIVHRLKDGKGEGPDKVWGLSWRVADIEATRARLLGAGVDVSEAREGRKPGTRVFTVKSGTCGVPTLMIQQGARSE
ncbi:MAG: VOC family protein [Afipia sp.]|nr:VOC family protein [Afipia sp.]